MKIAMTTIKQPSLWRQAFPEPPLSIREEDYIFSILSGLKENDLVPPHFAEVIMSLLPDNENVDVEGQKILAHEIKGNLHIDSGAPEFYMLKGKDEDSYYIMRAN